MIDKKLFIIGIAGGTGSGKTRAAKNLIAKFNESDMALIEQYSYYDHMHIYKQIFFIYSLTNFSLKKTPKMTQV